ncbi:hypothetical protein PoB_004081300 [Plakobranchus ocellatus]|uniref:Uncharacterized protein n=1 Tax=Plakobranchus ocellatus TaxID=259542 RepID=A0AAV4B6A1_9GAST|nr:hypothetical protein PoB_004081300 [Plakobranchus ocellatus]
MQGSKWLCFNWKQPKEAEDKIDNETSDDSDDEGYQRLDDGPVTIVLSDLSAEDNDDGCANKNECDNLHSPRERRGNGHVYTRKDRKSKKISRKLRRKEKTTRALHLLHVTWKWCKRGFMATVPGMGAMFNLAPSPAPVISSFRKRH